MEDNNRAYKGDVVQIMFTHGIEIYKVTRRYYEGGEADVGIICEDEHGEFGVFDGDYEILKKVNRIHNIV